MRLALVALVATEAIATVSWQLSTSLLICPLSFIAVFSSCSHPMDECRLDTFFDAVLNLELSLPPENIRSNRFFHGKLNRQATESLLRDNGHFLVRESSSQPGQYVLSCFFKGSHLHFIIHEHQSETNECARLQFSFDEDKFNSIRELIAFHVNGQAPITSASGAIICQAVERSLPLEAKRLELYHRTHPKWSLNQLLTDIDQTIKEKNELESELDEQLLSDCAAFSSDYLIQIQLGASAINLEAKCKQQLFCSGLDASKQVCDTIAHTGPGILASHLFKRNLVFVGLDFDRDLTQYGQCPLRSGIELMCLPTGAQMRRDIIIRHECLKYFVVMTILKAPDTATQFDILTKWIQVASKLFTMLGDYFGFGALMAGLSHPKIAKLNNLWQQLRAKHSKEIIMYDTLLNVKFDNLLNAKEPLASNTSIPFVIQLCHLIECSSILNSKFLPMFSNMQLPDIVAVEADNHNKFGLVRFSLDKIIQHIELSSSFLDNLNLFERNAIVVFNGFFFKEPLLDELFKTTFQLKFLFDQNIDPIKLNHEIFRNLENQLSCDELLSAAL